MGYGIMGKTADMADVQETANDTIQKEGRLQKVTSK